MAIASRFMTMKWRNVIFGIEEEEKEKKVIRWKNLRRKANTTITRLMDDD